MNTQAQTTAVAAPLPAHMLNRGTAGAQRTNVMDTIHSMKVYNAAPNQEADPTKAGMLMIKNGQTEGKYQLFTKEVTVNILSVRKGINGSYNLLDEAGNPILDVNNEPKRGFAYTEEYFRFSKNTNEVFFKDKDANGITKQQIGTLKNLFKNPTLPDGRKNPYHKIALDRNNIAYDSSFMSESFVIYGVFMDGEYQGEYFRLFISSAGFGNKWDSQTKTSSSVPNSLNDALLQASKAFNTMYQGQGHFDDSLLVAKLTPMLERTSYMPRFLEPKLVTTDNSEQFKFIEDLRHAYMEQEFSEYGNTAPVEPTPVAAAIETSEPVAPTPVMATPVQATAQAQTMQAQANAATQQVNNQPQGGYYTPNAEQRGQMEEVRNPVTGQPAPAQAQPIMPAQGAHAAMQEESEWDISISDVPF